MRNLVTKIELNRKYGNLYIVLFFILLILSFLNYITYYIINYYDFNIDILGMPAFKYYFSPFLIFKVKDEILLGHIKTILSRLYLIFLGIILITIYINKNKNGLLGSGRFATMQELYEKGYISLGNNLKNGVILGRCEFKYTFRSFIFMLDNIILALNVAYIFTRNLYTLSIIGLIVFLISFFLILICEKKLTIIDSTNSHIGLIAQTRSGKGAGVIIPTGLNWEQSLIALDVKKEIYIYTKNYREQVLKNKILLFEPFNDKPEKNKVRYNPLAEIRIGTKNEVDDCYIIAEILTAPPEAKDKNHWTESAKNLVFGAILHLAYVNKLEGKEVTLGEVYDFLTSDNLMKKIKECGTYLHESENFFKTIYDETQLIGVPEGTHPLVKRWANEMSNKRGEEFSDILSTTLANISLFKSPLVRWATSKSDFKMNDIANKETPYSLYLVLPEEQIQTSGMLIKLMITMFISKLTPKDFVNNNNKYETLALLDELPLFNYIPQIERGSGFAAGAKIKLLVVGQSLSQFYKIYGEKNMLLDNLANNVFYASATTDLTTAEKVSKLLGNKTIVYKNASYSQKLFSQRLSDTTTKRELLTPDEIINLPEDKNLIMLRGDIRTVLGKKIQYYKESYFNKKANLKEKN